MTEYKHSMKIFTGHIIKTLEKEYKEYIDSIQDKYGDAFNVSHWIELAPHTENEFPLPLIHIFVFVEQY